LALVGLVLLVATGLAMRFQLPPGSGEKWALWGMTRHEWGNVHFWVALYLMGVMLIHLALHWKWILSAVRGKPPEASGIRFILGLLALLFLLALVAGPLVSTKEVIPAEEREPHHETQKEQGAGQGQQKGKS